MIGLLIRRLGGRFFGIGVVTFFMLLFAGEWRLEAQPSTYPTRPITLTCPWGAGTTPDLTTRVIAPKLSKMWGVPVEVVNKPGGSGIVGTHAVMRDKPDGYSLLVECPGSSSMQLGWDADVPYKVEERTFVARVVVNPFVIIVPASAPWKTLGDVEQAIRKDPGSFKWPFVGTSAPDLAIGQFRLALTSRGVDLAQTKVVPYSTAAQVYTAVAGNHVQIYAGGYSAVEPLARAEKLRIIAVTSPKRCKFYSDLPTTAEQGFPNVVLEFWVGYSGPRGLPENVVKKWIDALKTVLDDPEMLPTFDRLAILPALLAGDDFKKFVMDEAKMIKGIGVLKPK